MKVIVNYDPATGNIHDSNGMHIITWLGLNYEEVPTLEATQAIKDSEPVELAKLGYTAQQLISLRKAGVL